VRLITRNRKLFESLACPIAAIAALAATSVVSAQADPAALQGKTIKFTFRFAHCRADPRSWRKIDQKEGMNATGRIYISQTGTAYFFFSADNNGVSAKLNAGIVQSSTAFTHFLKREQRTVPYNVRTDVEAILKDDILRFHFKYADKRKWEEPYNWIQTQDTDVAIQIKAVSECSVVQGTGSSSAYFDERMLYKYTCDGVGAMQCNVTDDEPGKP
jgi:hypothetical protein